MSIINNILAASGPFWTAWHGGIKQALLAIMALCALFIVLLLFFPKKVSVVPPLIADTPEELPG